MHFRYAVYLLTGAHSTAIAYTRRCFVHPFTIRYLIIRIGDKVYLSEHDITNAANSVDAQTMIYVYPGQVSKIFVTFKIIQN